MEKIIPREKNKNKKGGGRSSPTWRFRNFSFFLSFFLCFISSPPPIQKKEDLTSPLLSGNLTLSKLISPLILIVHWRNILTGHLLEMIIIYIHSKNLLSGNISFIGLNVSCTFKAIDHGGFISISTTSNSKEITSLFNFFSFLFFASIYTLTVL